MDRLRVLIRRDFDGHLTEFLEYRDCLFREKEQKAGYKVTWSILEVDDFYILYVGEPIAS